MSRQQRLVFAGIAVLIAVVAVVVLGGGSDAETERADRPPAATPTATPTAGSTATPEATATATPTAEPTPEPVEIEVEGGQVKGGEAEIDVEKGDTVRFTVKADVADHVHVHGYDVLRDITPGKPVRFSFKATITGVFEVELEDAGLAIARIRVAE